MFESLSIENFQKHDMLRIKFDPRITTIVGPSDSGKSAIIRALQWVATNKPGGVSFIKSGTDQTSVTLSVDGHEITRNRSATVNEYLLDGSRFVSFGASVPDQVSVILNIDRSNWQSQHDSPFWLGCSGGEVSRELNRVVNLQVIDNALGFLAGRLRDAQTISEHTSKERDQKKFEFESLEFVPDFCKQVEELESRKREIDDLSKKIDSIKTLKQEVLTLLKEKRTRSLQVAAGTQALESGQAFFDCAARLKSLVRIEESLIDLRASATVSLPESFDKQEEINQINELNQRISSLKEIIKQVHSGFDSVKKASLDLVRAEETFKVKTEGVCPICGNPLK